MFALAPTPARAAEHALAGIHIFASYKEVMHIFGEPTQILTGVSATQGSASNSAAGMGAAAGAPIGPNQFGPPAGVGMQGQAGAFGPANQFRTMMNRPPQFGPPQFGQPSSTAPAGFGAPATGVPSADTNADPNDVRYVYKRSDGTILEFLLSADGRVIQIDLQGYKAATKTSRGISLGSKYGDVTDKYGYPEAQETSGDILTMEYLEKQDVSFQIHHNKVVGITVVAAK
jgi:hypothetical protein